jgi:hypothetical protein
MIVWIRCLVYDLLLMNCMDIGLCGCQGVLGIP